MTTQIACPNCGTAIPADQINIQKLVAVCPACDTVFQFEPPSAAAQKAKRRKVKQPPNMIVTEDDHQLEMAFRTNFRLDSNGDFQGLAVGAGFGIVLFFITGSLALTGEVPLLAPLLFAGLALGLGYGAGTIAYNRTHIVMTDDQIEVSRKPLPAQATNTINLSGVARFSYEETAISVREGYDTPRYHVWAEMMDDTRKIVVTDMVDDYAIYITQRLNQRLAPLADEAAGRLADDVESTSGIWSEAVDAQQSSAQRKA